MPLVVQMTVVQKFILQQATLALATYATSEDNVAGSHDSRYVNSVTIYYPMSGIYIVSQKMSTFLFF